MKSFLNLKRKTYLKIIALLMLVPKISLSQGAGLIACSGPDCTLEHVFETFRNIVNWAISIGIVLISITLAYAGFIYMTSGGNSSKISESHEMFKKALVGFLITLGAFLIIQLITFSLGYESSFIKLVK